MKKNLLTNKITNCCVLPFPQMHFWLSNIFLNSDADREFIISKLEQSGNISVDAWRVLINSGTLESDASLTKAQFLAWFECNRPPSCPQLKLIIEGFKLGNYNPLGEYGVGWTEVYVYESYNGKIIKKIIGYVGGIGDVPSQLNERINFYLGDGIITLDKNLAIDFKGESGANGTAEIPDWMPISYVEKSLVIRDNNIYRVIENETATSSDVPKNSDVWELIGGVDFDVINNIYQDHPENRSLTGFGENVDGVEYYGEKDCWFDGKERKFSELYIGSENSGIANVGLFEIVGNNALVFSTKDINLNAGINIFKLSDITDSIPIYGKKYQVLIQCDGTTIGTSFGNAGRGYVIFADLHIQTTNLSHTFYIKTKQEVYNVWELTVLNSILKEVFLLPNEETTLAAFNEWNRQFTNKTKSEYNVDAPENEVDSINDLDLFYGGSGNHTNKGEGLKSIFENLGGTGDFKSDLDYIVAIRNKMVEIISSKDFVFEITTTQPNTYFKLPTPEKSNEVESPEHIYLYDYKVKSWGDGTPESINITSYNAGESEHIFVEAGVYQIRISGLMEAFLINEDRYAETAAFNPLPTKVISWGDTKFREVQFTKCINLKTVPTDKIGSFKNLIHAKGMFFVDEYEGVNGSGIQRIPKGFFNYAVNAIRFHYTFHGLSIREIPENLFDHCINAGMFQTCFEYAREIQEIPEEIFRYNVNATNFTWVFNGCHALKKIPENVFKWNTEAIEMKAAFGETRVLEIPEGLFRYNTKAKDLSGMFYAANGITTVPKNLFKYNVEALDMSYIFDGSPTIMDIPEDLFKYNYKVVDFWRVFADTNIKTIPEGIFSNNSLVIDFSYAFEGCDNLEYIPTGLFLDKPHATNFEGCFKGCTSLKGFFPKLWVSHPNANGLICYEIYSGQSNLFNSQFIPTDWAGDSQVKGLLPVIENGGFDKDIDWTKNSGSAIVAGKAIIKSLGNLTSNNGGIMKTPEDKILSGDKLTITIKVRQLRGIGKFQISNGVDLLLNHNVSNVWQEYTFDVVNTSLLNQIKFGGETEGDVFEIDDFSINKAIRNGSFDKETEWFRGTFNSGVARFTATGNIGDTSGNWRLYQELTKIIPNGTVVNVSLKARQVSGSGNFQAGFNFQKGIDEQISNTFTTYNFQMTLNADRTIMSFGGFVNGDVFEVDDIVVNY